MDSNKENRMKVITTITKIPIPQEPLPVIPKKLLERKDVRCPLRNINHIEKTNTKVITKLPFKIDTTHVTTRKQEELDWDYKVFRDEIIARSDAGPSDNCREVKITPLKSPLAVNRIKNIKRSLKRPHSRELQGLSPEAIKKKAEGNFKRRLDFKTVDEKLHSFDSLPNTYETSLIEVYTRDVVQHMLSVEKRPFMPHIRTRARACVMNWLMKINAIHGNATVIQTAQWYLDTLLSIRHIRLDYLQVVAAACYWIAQKTSGPIFRARKLVKYSNYAFTVKELMAAERTVLLELKFPTTPVVPQDFISYLSLCCESSKLKEVEMAATFICMSALMVEKSLNNEYPSVVGAAAVKNAMLLLGKNLATLDTNSVYQAAVAKARDFSCICSVLRKAVTVVSSPLIKFKAPLEIYGVAPHFIAQKIVNAATETHEMDIPHKTSMEHSILYK